MNEYENDEKESPEESWFVNDCFPIRLMVCWVYPIVCRGIIEYPKIYRFPRLNTSLKCSVVEKKFNKIWSKLRKLPLGLVLSFIYCFFLDFIISIFAQLVSSVCFLLIPKVMERFLKLLFFPHVDDAKVMIDEINELRKILPRSHEIYPPPASDYTRTNDWEVWLILLAMTIIYYMGFWCIRYSIYLSTRVGVTVRAIIVSKMYQKCFVMSGKSRSEFENGVIMNHLTTDITKLERGFFFLFYGIDCFIMIVGSCYFLVDLIDWGALTGMTTVVVVLPAAVIVIIIVAFVRTCLYRTVDKRINSTNELLQNIKIVKFFGWEWSFVSRIEKIRKKEMLLTRITMTLLAIVLSFFSSITTVSCIVAFGTFYLVHGHIDIIKIFTAMTYFNLIKFPLSFLAPTFGIYLEMLMLFGRIQKILVCDEFEERFVSEDKEFPIVIENGSFQWEVKKEGGKIQELTPEEGGLKDINLRVKGGDLVTVIGAIGSGKSSLLHAILGEMKKVKGNVKVFGDVIVYTSQIPWILNGTLYENVCFGETPDEEKWNEIVDVCQLKQDLEELDGGRNILIGEKGVNLSGGQKYRVQLARACYYCKSHKDAVVVLDDPLASVDAHVGKKIFHNCLNGFLRSHTRVLVTHRLDVLKYSDYVVLMDKGRIKEQGTLEDLMEKGEVLHLIRDYTEVFSPTGMTPGQNIFSVFSENETEEEEEEGEEEVIEDMEEGGKIIEVGREDIPLSLIYSTSSSSESDGISQDDGQDSDEEDSSQEEGDEKEKENFDLTIDLDIIENEHNLVSLDKTPLNVVSSEPLDSDRVNLVNVRTDDEANSGIIISPWVVVAFVKNMGCCWGVFPLFFIVSFFTLTQLCFVGTDWWITEWSNEKFSEKFGKDYQLYLYISSISTDLVPSFSYLDYDRFKKSPPSAVFDTNFTLYNESNPLSSPPIVNGKVNCTKFDSNLGLIDVPSSYHCPTESTPLGWCGCRKKVIPVFWEEGWDNGTKIENGITHTESLIIYGSFGAICLIAGFIAYTIFFNLVITSSHNLHNIALRRVVHAKQSFFDTTPIGRVLSRFSTDLTVVDGELLFAMTIALMFFYSSLGMFFMIIYSTDGWGSIFILPILVVYISTFCAYRKTNLAFKRIESVSRTPYHCQVSETLNGLSTLRAFSSKNRFVDRIRRKIDENSKAYMMLISSQRWLGVHLGIFSSLFIFLIGAVFICLQYYFEVDLDISYTSLAMSYSIVANSYLHTTVEQICDAEVRFNSYERIESYTKKIPLEKSSNRKGNHKKKSSDFCVEEGRIEFRKYSMRYREGLDLVLKKISFIVHPGEKIGVVGRTGSGKSSILVALWRLCEAAEGEIFIDGRIIQELELQELRNSLSIIPQEPTLFSGTVRSNLDPFSKCKDSEIWEVLDRTHMKNPIQNLKGKLLGKVIEGGNNFSVGERQLLCLARALIRNTKILVLDEATASVDLDTDQKIQKTIRECFKDRTCLTIAHRIETVMDSDRILVVDSGKCVEFDSPANLMDENQHYSFFRNLVIESQKQT